MALNLEGLRLDIENAKYFDGIHFFPIISEKNTQNTNNYRFLWEGMEEKKVDVEELKSSSVPTVTLTNKSSESYIAYRGNIIRGGGQNRQILHSFVVPAQKSLQIPVQCIQQGRWNPNQNKQFSQKAGEVTSSSMRFKSKTQSDTWNTITEQSTRTHTISCSYDYTVNKDYYTGSHQESITAESSITSSQLEEQNKRAEGREKAQKMLKEMENPLPNQVGIYVVMVDADEFVHGKTKLMDCLELFGNPDLYQKVHKEVTASFITDVVMYLQGQKITLPPATQERFQAFLTKIKGESWKSASSVGEEKREEIAKSERSFGESISINDEMIHVMCSIY